MRMGAKAVHPGGEIGGGGGLGGRSNFIFLFLLFISDYVREVREVSMLFEKDSFSL